MRHPQLIVYESDGRLAALLRPLAHSGGWALREPRQIEGCLRLLERGGPGVVVVKAGRDLEGELGLIDRARCRQPEVTVVVVGDADHARVAGLAWDLGAAYVHLPPQSRDGLLSIVAGLMDVAFIEEGE
jgi:hypothetical protein